MMYSKLVIWQKPDGTIYYRKIKNLFGYNVGYINAYNHKVIFSIDLNELFYRKKLSLRTRLINKLINWLEKKKN